MSARIGRYEVLREIARGGMATVYEAVDPTLHRRVALKVLREGEATVRLIERLHREAAAAALLRHPGIVAIHEVSTVRDADGTVTHFIAMDYVAGTTLAQAYPDMSLRERLQALETVAQAVAFAHEQHIVHRDLKPQNVLVEPVSIGDPGTLKWRLYLTDFGLAKTQGREDLTRTGSTVGTPYYMAPEQVRGDRHLMGPGTDVWALGVMLYEMLTGYTPFAAKTVVQTYQRILSDDPEFTRRRGKDIPADLQTICLKALSKEPFQRYPNAAGFAEDLRRYLKGDPILARPLSTWQRVMRRLARNKALYGALAGLVVATAAGGVLAVLTVRSGLKLAHEEERFTKRKQALERLTTLWSTIIERKRELRLSRLPPQEARRELERAVQALDEVLQEDLENPQGLYVRARGRMYLGDFDGAEQDLRTLLARHPDFRPAWSLLGVLKVERYLAMLWGTSETEADRVAKARPILDEACAAFGEGSQRPSKEQVGLAWTREDEIMTFLAEGFRLRHKEQREEDARHLLEDAWAKYRAEEYALYLGIWCPSLDDGIRWLTEAVSLAPGYAEAWLSRGARKRLLNDCAGAIADFDRALAIRPEYVEALYNRGIARSASGDLSGAIDDYDRAIAIRPDFVEAYYNRGSARYAHGNTLGSIADFDRVLELWPDWAPAFYNRAIAKEGLGNVPGALADYDLAIQARRDFAEAYANRGLAKKASGDVQGAVADYTRAIELRPNMVEPYLNRGIAQREVGDLEGAIRDYDQAIAVQPRNAQAYYNRGIAKRAAGDVRGAIEDYGHAIEIRPDYADAYCNRGVAEQHLGELREALADFTRALGMRGRFPEAYVNRASVRQSLGDLAGATEDLEAALRTSSPEWPLRREIEQTLRRLRAQE